MDERERRLGQNEALFRQVNEHVRGVNESFGSLTERMEIVCECGDASCAQRISIGIEEYEELRSNPDRFVVAPGHVDPTDVEEVVAHGGGWEIVQKRAGEASALAERTHPRS